MDAAIPAELRALFADDAGGDAVLARLVEVYGRAVGADRCVLFLYQPEEKLAAMTHTWQARPEWALASRSASWRRLPADLARQDPMYALALVDPQALYIDDVESARPELVNLAYEREHFGHRALIHAPLLETPPGAGRGGRLWGVLEPCTMTAPRVWSERDRAITAWTQARALPLARRFVEAIHGPCR